MTPNTQTKPRRKLFTPSHPELIRELTDRELQILYQVGYGKYMTGQLIAARLRYKCLDAPVVTERIVNGQTQRPKQSGQKLERLASNLFDQGAYLHRNLIQVMSRAPGMGSHKMVYELPAKGRRELQKVKSGSTKEFALPRSNSMPQIKHTLMINHLRVAVAVECEQNPSMKLLKCLMRPKDLKYNVLYYPPKGTEATTKYLIPDMLLGIGYGKWRLHYFNEATATNKEPQRILDKVRRYEAYDATRGHQKQHEMKSFGVLFTTEDHETRDKLRALVTNSPIKHRLFFGCIEDIDPWNHETALDPIWVTGASTEPTSLLPNL